MLRMVAQTSGEFSEIMLSGYLKIAQVRRQGGISDEDARYEVSVDDREHGVRIPVMTSTSFIDAFQHAALKLLTLAVQDGRDPQELAQEPFVHSMNIYCEQVSKNPDGFEFKIHDGPFAGERTFASVGTPHQTAEKE